MVRIGVKVYTHREVLRYVTMRVATAVALAAALTWAMATLYFGDDPTATVTVGFLRNFDVCIAMIIAGFITAGLSYRSAAMMRELVQARNELLQLASSDPLTGLLNRRGLKEAAHASLAARPSDTSVSILMCDVDRFKYINDTFGHEAGDRALVGLGAVIKKFATDRDLVAARYGGEEFAVLIFGASRAEAIVYAEHLRLTCSGEQVLAEVPNLRLTVSIGLATAPADLGLSAITAAADRALYEAKKRGRDRVVKRELRSEAFAA